MRALVVGAGIAGPVTAMALQRAGVDAVVIEAYPPSGGEVGSYFTVTPNGLDALAAVDALHLAVDVGFPTRRNVMRGRGGRVLGDLPLGAPLADGTPALTMKRSELSARLVAEAADRGIEVRHGLRVTSTDTTDGRVTAALANGASMTGDLLIGTDGVHSVVRRSIDPAAPAGRYVGLTNFGGITPAGAVTTTLEPETWQFWFGRQAFFGAHRTPSDDLVWFVNEPRAEITPHERESTSRTAWLARLATRFDEDASPVADLIRAGRLELAADNTYDLGHVARWHRGRMIVIGDAAHAPSPSSGQGASMALEDSVLLAMALRDHASVEKAFTAFESARRDRVEKIVAYGARSSGAKVQGPVGSVLRDAGMRLVFRFAVTEKSLAWMYDHRVGWDDAPAARPQPTG